VENEKSESVGNDEFSESETKKKLKKRLAKQKEFQKLFDLPSDQSILVDFTASLNKHGLLHTGKLYVSQDYFCFYSNIFGIKTVEVMHEPDVVDIVVKMDYKLGGAVDFVLKKDKIYNFVWLGFDVENDVEKLNSLRHTNPVIVKEKSKKLSKTKAEKTKNRKKIKKKEKKKRKNENDDGESLSNYSDSDSDEETDDSDESESISKSKNEENEESVKQKKPAFLRKITKVRIGDEVIDLEKEKADEFFDDDDDLLSDSMYTSSDFLSAQRKAVLLEDESVSVKDPIRFFRLFFSDESDFVENYRGERGDEEVEVASWQSHPQLERVREITYKAPVNAAIGPATTRVQETQRYHLKQDQLVVESVSCFLDIPYGDYFRVEQKFTITTAKNNSDNKENEESSKSVIISGKKGGEEGGVLITVSVGVNFVKSTLFKSKIERGVISETRQGTEMWLKMAREFAETAASNPALISSLLSPSSRRNSNVNRSSTLPSLLRVSSMNANRKRLEKERGSKADREGRNGGEKMWKIPSMLRGGTKRGGESGGGGIMMEDVIFRNCVIIVQTVILLLLLLKVKQIEEKM